MIFLGLMNLLRYFGLMHSSFEYIIQELRKFNYKKVVMLSLFKVFNAIHNKKTLNLSKPPLLCQAT